MRTLTIETDSNNELTKYDTKQALQHLQGGTGFGVPGGVLHVAQGGGWRIIRKYNNMEQKFGKNSIDIEALREFCEREGEEIAYPRVTS